MAAPLPQIREKIRVMLVDDSAVIRGFINRMLLPEADIEVVASVSDGALAVSSLKRTPVDVIILDIEMPNMDGLTAIPLLLKEAPGVQIVMASTLTLKNASISLAALSAGAADYLPKPTAAANFSGGGNFNRELVQKVRALGGVAKRYKLQRTDLYVVANSNPKMPLRMWPIIKPNYIAIGSSTGGPQALFEVLKHLNGVKQPIFVTQHMPPTFTSILAENITRQCNITCVEAKQGMEPKAGRIHLAPGGYHMSLSNLRTIMINQEPPENFCRPSVDYMLRGLAATRQPVLTAILTGMGQDGAKGCKPIIESGGAIIAQDESTSVVWGMPRAAAETGLCSAILPLDQIGPKLKRIAMQT